MKVLILIVFLFSISANASKRSIKQLRDKITNQSSQLNKLAAQIKEIDNQLGSSNNRYLAKMKDIEDFEKKVEQLKGELSTSAASVSKEVELSKLAFDRYLLEVSDAEVDTSLKAKKIYYEILSKKLKKLKKAQAASNKNLQLINNYEQKIGSIKKEEESLYQFIMELEKQKKEYGQEYISLMEDKNQSEIVLDKVVAKLRVRKKNNLKKNGVLFQFDIPLEKYVSINKTKEGINLKYSQTTPILAPRAGKIVYAGELASYGNVVIIDHGQDVRSVLLGDLVAKVKKGDVVNNKQLLGYTIADLGNVKSLYFEVRKKDIVQNTANWLAKKKVNI